MGRGRQTGATAGALAALGLALPLAAGPVAEVSTLPEGARVIDVRAENACRAASHPGARCLPADWLFAAEGGPIDPGLLRWLLGTLGLAGGETVAVYPAEAPGAAAAAGLIHLAGQAEVVLLAAGDAAPPGRGTPRSFSREVVYLAPMRRDALEVTATPPEAPLPARLAAYARGDAARVAFPATH